jgi:hypothetical protein
MDMKDQMREQGCSKEDEYFFRKDKELLTKMREAADLKKKQLADEHREQAYWMRCPKCGGELREESLKDVVRVDRCQACNGIFFDDGDLDLFIKSAR